MNEDIRSDNARTGLAAGLLIGLMYCISLFLRYKLVASGPVWMGVIGFITFVVVLSMLAAAGLYRRRQLGGYIELKHVFQTLFIAILIGELFYVLFNVIYLKYIDPAFIDKMKTAFENYYQKLKIPDEQLEAMIKNLDNTKDETRFSGIISSYGIFISVMGVFGLMLSLLIRKNKPASELN